MKRWCKKVAALTHTAGSLLVQFVRSCAEGCAAGGAHLVDALGTQDLHQRVAARAARVRAAIRVRLAVALLMDAVQQLDVRAVAEGRVLRRDGPATDWPASVHVRLPAQCRGHAARASFHTSVAMCCAPRAVHPTRCCCRADQWRAAAPRRCCPTGHGPAGVRL